MVYFFSFSRLLNVNVVLGSICYLSSAAFAVDIQPAISAYKDFHLDQAQQLFEIAVKDDLATKNEYLYYLGRIAFDKGDAEKAKDYLSQSVEIEPNSSDEYYWLGRAYGELAQKANIFKQASYASSVHKYFQLAVDADPKNVAAHRGLFVFYIMAPSIMGGSIDAAEKTIADIRAISPVDADIKQADLYGKKEESEKRLRQARFLVATYPSSAEALFTAGHILREQKQLPEAIASFEAASRIPATRNNKMFVENSLFHFGETCHWANTRIDEAIASVEKYLEITADNKNVNKNWPIWTLAKLYLQKGDTEKYESLKAQLDPVYVKQDKRIKDEIKQLDKK